MPKTTKPLSPTEVKNAKPKDKEYMLADGGGLQLRVKPTGAKSWVYRYKNPLNGKRSQMGFGAYPAVSLADARRLREDADKVRAKGVDPQQHREVQIEKQYQLNDNTLKRVALLWFSVKKTKVTASYADDIIRSLERYIFPELGNVPISDIKAPATIKVLKPVEASGSLETLKRLAQRLNEIMNYAVNTGLVDANPLSGIRHAFESPKKKNQPTIKPDQLPDLMRDLTNASIKRATRCLIEWQLNTMTRPSEAAGTRWDEIDFDKQIWNIPAERMKKKRPHSVPLSPQALALLETMRPISGEREYVFPSYLKPSEHINSQTANMALKRMGYKGLLVAHGLRSLASTTLNEQGFDPDVIEAALAHVDSNEVRAAYNRADYLERRRVMMDWWSEHIEQAATGNMSMAAGTRTLRPIS
ncbi:tyrosine-type recombinase/integrase [Pseudomaricurvus alkylphenolicus]|uniref:integrase domain-containing protein n=1 Tax=Pseudomaricurvus alkylphenolicus TaxID=1306991 RepID=UPI0014210E23|nr:tyrosine-type recombinase/integrase [Pseudomaricurvus alkylphenolicus]